MANHNNLSWKAPMYFVFVAGGLIIQYSDLVLDGSGSTAEILPMIHVLAAFLILSFGLAFTMVSVVLPKLPISTTGLKKLAVIILLLVVAVTVVAIDVFLRDEEKGKSMANPTVRRLFLPSDVMSLTWELPPPFARQERCPPLAAVCFATGRGSGTERIRGTLRRSQPESTRFRSPGAEDSDAPAD
ncbi:hypothetical protein AAC387_Pa06g1589 [Persea americana]